MGFRRSIRILPWISLNFGKRGASTSMGVRDAVRESVGLSAARFRCEILFTRGESLSEALAAKSPNAKARRGWPWIGLTIAISHLVLASCGSPNAPLVTAAIPEPPVARGSLSISREIAHIFIGLVADIRVRRSGNSVDDYAFISHWRVMPEDMKIAINAKTGFVGKVKDQLVMLGSDGTNDIFSLSIRDHFQPEEVLSELAQVYKLEKKASDISDGTQMDVYAMSDHGASVGLLTITYGVVNAISGAGTIAFIAIDRAKREMPDYFTD